MFKLKRGDEETTVTTEMACGRHMEAGWVLLQPEEKQEEEPKKRGPKPKDKVSE